MSPATRGAFASCLPATRIHFRQAEIVHVEHSLWAVAAGLGRTVLAGVSKKSTLLVVGNQDLRIVGGVGKSSKHRNAEEMIAKGHPIRILSESDYQRMVGEGAPQREV